MVLHICRIFTLFASFMIRAPLIFFVIKVRGQFLKKRKTFVQKVTSKKTLFETPYHPQDLRISQVRRESGSSALVKYVLKLQW